MPKNHEEHPSEEQPVEKKVTLQGTLVALQDELERLGKARTLLDRAEQQAEQQQEAWQQHLSELDDSREALFQDINAYEKDQHERFNQLMQNQAAERKALLKTIGESQTLVRGFVADLQAVSGSLQELSMTVKDAGFPDKIEAVSSQVGEMESAMKALRGNLAEQEAHHEAQYKLLKEELELLLKQSLNQFVSTLTYLVEGQSEGFSTSIKRVKSSVTKNAYDIKEGQKSIDSRIETVSYQIENNVSESKDEILAVIREQARKSTVVISIGFFFMIAVYVVIRLRLLPLP
jgi:predicted  nucleic acid-binding Zn-ribbon protein